MIFLFCVLSSPIFTDSKVRTRFDACNSVRPLDCAFFDSVCVCVLLT